MRAWVAAAVGVDGGTAVRALLLLLVSEGAAVRAWRLPAAAWALPLLMLVCRGTALRGAEGCLVSGSAAVRAWLVLALV